MFTQRVLSCIVGHRSIFRIVIKQRRSSRTCFFLIKLNWLDNENLGVLSMIHPDFEAMTISIPRYYASHTSITPTHVLLLTACAVHYDLDFGLVTCYLGGKYTAEWRDVNEIISTCKPIVSPLKYSARWSVFSPQDVHRTSIGKKTQPTSAPLSLGATSLPLHSMATWA